jgi:DeoR/GlpR family transcriptional regulator of sugar metabolism
MNGPVSHSDRKAYILEELEATGFVDINGLVEKFTVSGMTIRRDLIKLEKEGLLRRVHGGAINHRGRSYEPPLRVRLSRNIKAKTKIGKYAASLVEEGDAIALDVGSTTMEIAKQLPNSYNLTILTSSLAIANQLYGHPLFLVVLSGGIIRRGEGSLIGDLAVSAYKGLYIDKLFLGIGGINEGADLTEYNWDDVLVKKAMIKSAKEVFVVADSSKFNLTAFVSIANFNEIHHLITDKMPNKEILSELQDAGVTLHIAK